MDIDEGNKRKRMDIDVDEGNKRKRMDIDDGNKRKRVVCRRQRIPIHHHEIWYEILTRLSIKKLTSCKAVCRSWSYKVFVLHHKPKTLPLCGLILKSSFGVSNLNTLDLSYINLTTKEVTSMRPGDPKSYVLSIASDGNDEYRLMSDSSFDFGGLFERTPSRVPVTCPGKELPFDFGKLFVDKRPPQSHTCFFAIHGGLVLVVHEDGSYLVHNPLTRKVTRLPTPPSFKKYDSVYRPLEKVGFIIKNSSRSLNTGWRYDVVRVCRLSRLIEEHKSYKAPLRWRVSKLRLDEDLIQACWYWENNAVFPKAQTLFFLTNKDRGVAMTFGMHSKPETYGFGLPRLVQEGFENARLGTCGDCLHLSYYNSNGVWIWKHVIDGNHVTHDTWIPLLEVSRYRQLCKPLATEYLCNVLNAGGLVVPLGFHPVDPIVFLCVNSCVFSYHLDMDTFDKIVEIADIEHRSSSMAIFPYSPCLASLVPKRFMPSKQAPREQDDVMH